MGKIVIDVVLLPPEEIMDKAIEINNELKDDKIVLNKENCSPHITLCMGVVEEDKLDEIKGILKQIAAESTQLSLEITGIEAKHSTFEIKITDELQKLHEKIMNKLSPYLTYDATTDMCFSPPPVEEKTLFWIKNYKASSFENFHPHITLAVQKLENKELNIRFTASRFALYHLGNYCTCRKILFEEKLSEK